MKYVDILCIWMYMHYISQGLIRVCTVYMCSLYVCIFCSSLILCMFGYTGRRGMGSICACLGHVIKGEGWNKQHTSWLPNFLSHSDTLEEILWIYFLYSHSLIQLADFALFWIWRIILLIRQIERQNPKFFYRITFQTFLGLARIKNHQLLPWRKLLLAMDRVA